MDCFYLIDKPIGITSFDVLRKLKKILNIKKMGHTGTLDPLATGLLLVAIGNYTKLIPYFEKDTKEYEFKIQLDGTTPSFDSETEISFIWNEQKEYFKNTLTIEKINEILQTQFTGKISQMPPKYSALKVGWKKALDMVRNGEEFELKARDITIFEIEILDFSYPEIYLRAKVSAGTYIRSIARDLWEILGTGGYISFLRRTVIGKLWLSLSQTLDTFEISKSLPEHVLFSQEKFITLTPQELTDIDNGKMIRNNNSTLSDTTEYFVKNEEKISNIVKINGLDMQPIRKI